MIPVIVVCHDNHSYVQNTLSQLAKLNLKDVRIMDTSSSDPATLRFLKAVTCPVYHEPNTGPWITTSIHADVFRQLPEKFVLTDPDLQFNPNLQPGFLDELVSLSDSYQAYKVGFALDVSDSNAMFPNVYAQGKTILEWESQFWEHKIPHSKYELYEADIDTTFSLVNKNHSTRCIRIAGDFVAKHLPWYPNNPIQNLGLQHEAALKQTTKISTSAQLVRNFVQEHFYEVRKNNERFLIHKRATDPNENFWRAIYSSWESETFDVFDQCLGPQKVFLDLGGWIGTTCMYGARKSKHVFVVEADPAALPDLKANCQNNTQNVTIVDRAIYHIDDLVVAFGKNAFLAGSRLNDSTSHIQEEAEHTAHVKTIRVPTLLAKYGVAMTDLGLIKVDIEGGEEFILDDLFALSNVPLYISFHYSWWQNKDLDRFPKLTEWHKTQIRQNPFISLAFL